MKILAQQQADVRLLFLQEIAARRPHQGNHWLSPDGKITQEGLKCIVSLNEGLPKCKSDSRRVIAAMLRGFQVVAIDQRGRNAPHLFVQPVAAPRSAKPVEFEIGVGKSSSFFSALTFGLIQDAAAARSGGPGVDVRLLIDDALTFSAKWIRSGRTWLANPQHVAPLPTEYRMFHHGNPSRVSIYEQKLVAEFGEYSVPPESEFANFLRTPSIAETKPSTSVATETEAWESALSYQECGVINSGGPLPKIELHRSMTVLPGYVCLESGKQSEIIRIRDRVAEFAKHGGDRPLAAWLVAKPGTGKSFFAERLAEAAGLPFIDFNITTLVRREDLVHCFDHIVNKQTEHGSRPLFVFVDEIDAPIEGHPVYEAFLTPIEDKYYVRHGEKFSIRPCVWLFAGTTIESEVQLSNTTQDEEAVGRKWSIKRSDLESRMNIGIVHLGTDVRNASNGKVAEALALENVYVGIVQARRQFGDLSEVHRSVLIALRGLAPNKPLRKLRTLLEANLSVVLGRGRWRNLGRLFEHIWALGLADQDASENLIAGMCLLKAVENEQAKREKLRKEVRDADAKNTDLDWIKIG